jgi:hypothetical protein
MATPLVLAESRERGGHTSIERLGSEKRIGESIKVDPLIDEFMGE